MQGEDIADLVKAAQNDLGAGSIEDLASNLTDYVAYGQLLKDGGKRVSYKSGTEFEWNILVDKGNNAKWVGLYEADTSNVKQGFQRAKLPFRHFRSSWSYDELEVDMNGTGNDQILDLVQERQNMQIINDVETLEDAFWGTPDAANDKIPYFLKYFVVQHITGTSDTAGGGFNGTVPSGFTTVANVNPTTYPAFANWTFKYAAVTKADLIKKLKKAFYKTGFKSPIKSRSLGKKSDDFEMYTTYAVVDACEDRLQEQNENLGTDLAKYAGEVHVRRIPLIPVPQLDSNDSAGTNAPVYGINWAVFQLVLLKGNYFKQTPPLRGGRDQPSVWTIYRTLSIQGRCVNRRRLFVGSMTAV